MPTFTFVARDQMGRLSGGSRSAGDRQELIARLRAENLVVTSVTSEAGADAAGSKMFREIRDAIVLGRVRQSDLLVFARQMSAMLKAGVPLTDALQTLAGSVGNDRLRGMLQEVRRDVQRGRTFTEALRRHPAAFDTLFVSIVHAGETSGGLAQNIQRLATYLERKESFRRKLKSATAYPKFVIGFFTLLTSLIFLFLIPRFEEIFKDFGARLPPLTQACMDFSRFLRGNILIILPLLIGMVVAFVAFSRTPRGREMRDRAILRVPFFGRLLLEAAVARLAMTLGTLLSNGIPLADALQVAGPTLDNSVLETGVRNARRDVMKGHGFAESLGRVESLPRLLARMARVGEESGTLSGMLEDVANFYDQEVDHALSRITAVIEPVLISGMGVVVLITVIAIYLPIFSMGQTIRGG